MRRHDSNAMNRSQAMTRHLQIRDYFGQTCEVITVFFILQTYCVDSSL